MASAVLMEIDETQKIIDAWYEHSVGQLRQQQAAARQQLLALAERLGGLGGGLGDLGGAGDMTPTHPQLSGHANGGGADGNSPVMASPPGGYGGAGPSQRARTLEPGAGAGAEAVAEGPRRRERLRGGDGPTVCHVLVEFKRKRLLQYESAAYVAPGEYVVVGGDRGEDVGLVTHSWGVEEGARPPGSGEWAEGAGRVLRVATVLEVTQLQGVQAQLESRAVEVAQEKVRERGLAMQVVDAEYQFDRRKLTFYYRSQSRLDFRDLVRDLYKTFRARIWMEPDAASPTPQ